MVSNFGFIKAASRSLLPYPANYSGHACLSKHTFGVSSFMGFPSIKRVVSTVFLQKETEIRIPL